MGLVSLKSNLAINGTPQRYDTNGKLGDLPDGSSNLDFDSPVPAPVDNFTNTNANGFTIQAPVGVTQFVNDGQTSKLGWTGATPPTYDFFSSPFPSEGQEKLTTHGFPGTLPAPVDFILDRNAGGFTIQTPIGVTQFINDGQTSKLGLLTIPQKYDTTGKLINLPANASNLDIDGNATGVDWITNANALGFTIKAPVGVTQFVNNGQTSRLGWTGTTPPVYDFLSGINPSEGQEKVTSYGFPGPLPKPADWIGNTNAVGFTIQNPIGVSQFVNKGQTSQLGFTSPLPSGVDFIANNNANGFTIKAPIGVSQFVNNGQTSIYGFTSPLPAGVDNFPNINASGFTIQNPVGVSQFINNGQTSKYGFPGALPSGVDFIANNNAKGFTIQNPIGISQFVNKGQTSVYGFNSPLPSPVDNFPNINAKGFTIQNPIGVSQFINKGQTSQLGFTSPLPSGVDFIANTNAVGFTIKNPVGVSQFINNGQTSIYGFNSPLPSGVDFIANTNAVGFTIQAPIGVSQFINNGQTSIYGFPGPLPAPADNFLNTNANGFTIQNPLGVSQFVNDGQTSIYGFPGSLPAPVDFILNTNAGGFTIQNPIGVSQFINDGQTSIYGFPGALPAPVDNFLNTNANGFTIQNPIGVSQFINDGQTSIYGFPGSLPSPVDFIANNNAKGFTLQNPIGKSQFKGINIGSLSYINPTGNNLINTNQGLGVDFIPNYDARGFTIKMFKTQFKGINTNSLTYNTTSKYGNVQNNPAGGVGSDWLANNNAGGFIIKNPVGVSQFVGVDDANGVYNNTSLYGNIQNQPAGGIGSDWLANNHAYGFTIRMASSNFVAGGQTSIYGFWNPLPTTPANWLNDQNATGFTMKNPVGITQFVGADTANGIYINPTGNNLINTTPGLGSTDWLNNKAQINFVIKQRRLASNFVGISQDYTTYNNPTGNRIGVWNGWQDDRSGATGFKPRLDPYESNFIGISADNTKYQYPVTVKGARLLNVAMGSSLGTAKLENQLGAGSKMGNKGFYAENRYSEAVRNDSNQSLLASWSLRRRSPSPLEQQYSKFKIRDEAFNPTYMLHPLILRGIQNPDHLGPQRWGLTAGPKGQSAAGGLVAALDGGFIRGGASTALERAAIDTARIAKFMASPKGLIWAITQVGLGKSNIRPHGSMGYDEIARATQNPLPLLNNTQTHLGLTSLLSVPGSPFGLHFTRHGIPFLNESANYEYVLKRFTQSEIDTPGVMLHKHLRLKDELLDKEEPNAVGIGSPISNLSYTGGPQSVYGLGSTTIRRATDTLEGWKRYRPKHAPDPIKMQEVPTDDLPIEDIGSVAAQYSAKQAQDAIDANAAAAKTNAENAALQAKYDALEKEFNPKYGIKKQYSPELNLTKTGQGTIDEDKNNAKQLSNKLDNFKNIDDPEKMIGLSKKLSEAVKYDKWTPGNSKLSNNDPSPNLNKVSSNNINTISANQWNVLPYQELRKIAKERNSKTRDINDFRSSTNNKGKNSPLSTNPEIANYKTANIRDRYGYGEHGKLDQDRSNPYIKLDADGKATKEGNIDDTRKKLNKDGAHALSNDAAFRGDRINAIDFQKNARPDNVYGNTKDFIKFYFTDVDFFSSKSGDEAIVFRASIKGLADTFQPGWSNIQVMGRPDGPALYSSFERNISFNFTAAATTREELVPMWRKLNYLASYTMPIYSGGGRPGGALCRMTIGDIFNNTPGYFTGLTITVNDEATWDLADDIDVTSNTYKKFNKGSKQLPNLVDVDVQFRILHDWRPQKGGRVYHLYEGNYTTKSNLAKEDTSWLWDTSI